MIKLVGDRLKREIAADPGLDSLFFQVCFQVRPTERGLLLNPQPKAECAVFTIQTDDSLGSDPIAIFLLNPVHTRTAEWLVCFG